MTNDPTGTGTPPPPPPPPPPPSSPGAASSATPPPEAPDPMLVVDSPYEVANWRPLVNWLLYIPHGIITNAVRSFAGPVFLIHWLKVLFTGRFDRGLYGVLAMSERYSMRATGFLFGYSETWPPFDFDMGSGDDGAYRPIRVTVPSAPETTSRAAVFNIFLAIPHYVVLVVFSIGALVVLVVGWFAVLFTGRWPQGLRDFLVRLANYWLRVWAYVVMVTSGYPRFGL